MKHTALALVLVSATALLAGCGGGSSEAKPSGPPVTFSAPPGSGASTMSPAAAMSQAMIDVNQVVPKLEAYFGVHGYPTDIAAAAKSMGEAGVYMDPSDALATYKYDPKTKLLMLCVENDSGAWASYDSGSTTLGSHGLSGGCPKS